MTQTTEMMQLQDLAETICNRALRRACESAQARVAAGPSGREPALEQLLSDPAFVQSFKVGLAKGMANLFAAYDRRVLSVYLFGESGAPFDETAMTPGEAMRLLVLVQTRSAALDALGAALDQAVTREVQKLAAPAFHRQAALLNPAFITEDDVAQRKGVAVLFSSAFAPPLVIWKRSSAAA